MSRTVCLVTARMASARCPGKALQELLPGEPLLAVLLTRMRSSTTVDEVALATSVNPENDAIADLGRSLGVRVFRGEEEDVLKRHVDAAWEFEADQVVRVTGDNPLTDVGTMDALVALHHERQADYTYVPGEALLMGILAEVISRDGLERSWNQGQPKHRSELVTLYIKEHPTQFKIAMLDLAPGLLRPAYRLTVDHPEDIRLQREIFKLLRRGPVVETREAIALLDTRPDLVAINSHLTHKGVNHRSVELDALVKAAQKRRP
ncbi:MAG: NTP transferase domain-containing protein [Vicinamibacteria bacterium]|nr:NTP transferase domain-containing protein [Vicinamibacteria bacterium]